MTLYAFDGTWNTDDEEDILDTNVVRFRDAYQGEGEPAYISGVGTRFGALGKFLGGVFGIGGRTRVDEMYETLTENFKQGREVIDIVGFSRGSALAIHFANRIAEEGIELESGEKILPPIRFMALFDVVGSFGLSFDNVIDFQSINLGWNINSIPSNVEYCCHAMAMDERRESFKITRLNIANGNPNVLECWFRGHHSDVGGGNGNVERSNIALAWMLEQARTRGLPISKESIDEAWAKSDLKARFEPPKDLHRDERREIYETDLIHESAKLHELEPGEAYTCTVIAKEKWNWSGLRLKTGQRYLFTITDIKDWQDDDVDCTPAGWRSDELPWYNEGFVGLFEGRRRHPDANWFELIGAVGDSEEELFRIADGNITYSPKTDGELYTFANDLDSKYGNNKGSLHLSITRES